MYTHADLFISCPPTRTGTYQDRTCRIERDILKKVKAACTAAENNEKDALKVLAAEAAAQQNATKLKKLLSVKNLWTLLLYFIRMEKKEIASLKVGMIREHYNKLKDDNTPKKEYKK